MTLLTLLQNRTGIGHTWTGAGLGYAYGSGAGVSSVLRYANEVEYTFLEVPGQRSYEHEVVQSGSASYQVLPTGTRP